MNPTIQNGRHDTDAIERRLAEALRDQRPSHQLPSAEQMQVDTAELSSRELLQMAWDRAEMELDELQTELRRMRQKHQDAERALLMRINEKKYLQRELVARAGDDHSAKRAASGL